MIYDYLFYKSYQLAQRSKNFKDTPVLGGICGIMLAFMFNLFTVIFFIEGLSKNSLASTKIFAIGKYVFAGLLLLSMYLYFRYNDRWKTIVNRWEKKEKMNDRNIHPIIILLGYYVISFIMLILSGMYRNGDGLFK